MSPAQARAHTTSPASARNAVPALEYLARQLLKEKLVQSAGKSKARPAARTLARLLVEADGRRPLLIDTNPVRSLANWAEPAARTMLVDLP
ncbi:hypothetical protein [Streptomyces olivaceoviridis]|uniref:hypothetical protein n=1 Tax=Streptomyces olivaceoviridis TaxID=1921 RepID=UPI003787C60D